MSRDKGQDSNPFADALSGAPEDRADAVVETLWMEDDELAFPSAASEDPVGMLDRIKEIVGFTTKNAIKRENGLDYPARDYAYVPDPNAPSTWKLRLTESPGKVTVAQLGRAAAALSSGGFRGNRAEIPAAALSAVKRRIRAEYRRMGVREQQIPNVTKEASRFSVWKQAGTDQYRWLAVYSNNFRDSDRTPEIIAAESHELFVELVDKGLVAYPELWHFHVPGTRWGVADWVGYSEGFALASGTVDVGHEKEAESLMQRDDIGVSHGMPSKSILRDTTDPTIIVTHITSEISPLPMSAAANKLTGFFIKESEEMALSDVKKQHLISIGLSPDDINKLDNDLKETAMVAQLAGLDSKQTSDPEDDDPEADAQADDAGEAGASDADAEAEADDPEADATEQSAAMGEPELTRREVAEAIKAIAEVFGNRIDTLTATVGALTSEVKSLKEEDSVRVAKTAEATPAMSLADMIGSLAGFTKEAQLDGRSQLAKQKPAEVKSKDAAVTGLSFIDSLLVSQAAPQE